MNCQFRTYVFGQSAKEGMFSQEGWTRGWGLPSDSTTLTAFVVRKTKKTLFYKKRKCLLLIDRYLVLCLALGEVSLVKAAAGTGVREWSSLLCLSPRALPEVPRAL